jgi:hypothetical protein
MEKVQLTKADFESICNMYKSKDEDNHTVANEIINNCDHDKSQAWIILIYALTKRTNQYWTDNMPVVTEKISSLPVYSEFKPSASAILNTLLQINAQPEIVDSYLVMHVEELKNHMKNWGYPVEKLNYSISLNND